ncbi:uncharacterized protein CcaverHIS019_0204580 [Cutaneotrichosporon cavernicola]|uniref:Probable methionine--tRNA ligase, mitochondrial n=1 Tax=Cutaneotrichosporon cavernicola TaxID=279322 RepID=A0AA48I0X9_9TREE|nr:uncharacterized protein CcaverHIS019_0204580 [Cutaneotrichosporon cavernicola]BEI89096.1 hypothetical protein CcaverHIS019_0204580 [Cutaneotrichosporon cavernicola]BEI96872.1 hypothetical protein CcaverHIS631_0204610 [Cutaneotrichosporon cavernicola]BEJ04644.1 hypothetical protein CcaverHIS641_0204610 [Cutaneotrichosporon cavernicola]
MRRILLPRLATYRPLGLGGMVRARSLGLRFNSSQPQATETGTLPSFFSPPASEMAKPFYVTTPIFYVNASPHIGHLHTVVLTDVFARFSRLRHPDRQVVFSTGTDEHGLKIQQAAAKAGTSEQAFCDDVSQRFRDLSLRANISHTDFIRTSEERHYAAVEAFWAKLVASGNIYKGTHEGWYSVSDESFFSAKQVEERDGVMIATETGNEVTWETEENWKFRLDAYKPQLEAWLANPESVTPAHYHTAIMKEVEAAGELSISRPSSRVKWGVPVPGDESQTIYVWVDALINYLTVAGYPNAHDAWPADMHVVGQDIIRFHAFHWPALLAAAGEAMPKRVRAHAHWTMHKAKMSKSRGNVADPLAAMDKFGADGVRWYLMRAGGSLPRDSDYSESELEASYGRLQDQLGNLVSRLSSPKVLANVSSFKSVPHLDAALGGLRDQVEAHFEECNISAACEAVLSMLGEVNKFFTESAPWRGDGTAAVVYAYEGLRLAGILTSPILPSKSVELLDRISVPPEKRTWQNAVVTPDVDVIVSRVGEGIKAFKGAPPLFPKIDDDSAQHMLNLHNGRKRK